MKYEVLGNIFGEPVKSFSSRKRAFDYASKHSNFFLRSFSSRTGKYEYYDVLHNIRVDPFFVRAVFSAFQTEVES